MNPNGHKTARERLVKALELNGGQIQLRQLIREYGFKRSQIDDLLEIANSPITIKLHFNGHRQPPTMVVLKNPPTPQEPISQEALKARLDEMSAQEFYGLIDPTFKLRHQRRAGGGARTSTGSDEYLVNRDNIR